MITSTTIREIVAIYVKHGWVLRRVLLSGKSKGAIEIPADVVDGVSIVDSDLDALWFSRPPKPGGVAWEIRHLSTEPYSLLFTMDELDADFENALDSAENVFRSNLAGRKEA